MRLLIFHSPLIGMLLIVGVCDLIDSGRLMWLRSESTFG